MKRKREKKITNMYICSERENDRERVSEIDRLICIERTRDLMRELESVSARKVKRRMEGG